ncbi:hypothetical protein [Arthrobacter sp. RAF14]|uniref:hypothetical protein n=1 Tax=Arthrobacter sp. RAF14 TaxID=3233051 RepID=UPI003F901A04
MGKSHVVTALISALTLSLTACGGGPATKPAEETVAASQTSASASKAPEDAAPTATSPAPAEKTTPPPPASKVFSTPDGSMTFKYPSTWSVQPVQGQPNNFSVLDAHDKVRATFRDKLPILPYMSIPTDVDTGLSWPVAGIKGPGGQEVRLLLQATYGQAPGSQAAYFDLKFTGSKEPLGRAAVEIPAGGYYVSFGGISALKTGPGVPTRSALVDAARAFAKTPEFQETSSVITSLEIHPERIKRIGCFGTKYRYEKITGLSCDDAKGVMERVLRTGTGAGAHSVETADYLCFYASYVEHQEGQADVICQNKKNYNGIKFEAWLK